MNKQNTALVIFLALTLADCAGTTSATLAPTAAPKATATHAAVNTASLGGTVVELTEFRGHL